MIDTSKFITISLKAYCTLTAGIRVYTNGRLSSYTIRIRTTTVRVGSFGNGVSDIYKY